MMMAKTEKDWFRGYVIKELTIEKKRLEDEATGLRQAGNAAKAAESEEQIKMLDGKIALVADIPQKDIPQGSDVTVDPSNRAVTIDNLTFRLEPGTAPEPASIGFSAPQSGPPADSWDVYLDGHKVGWFGVSAQRNDGLFQVVEARTYVATLPSNATADFVAHAWVGFFDVGESPLPNRRKQ
jgi:hypothetical protein